MHFKVNGVPLKATMTTSARFDHSAKHKEWAPILMQQDPVSLSPVSMCKIDTPATLP